MGYRIFSQQYITQSQAQQNQLDDRNIAVTFMNYLKIYNQPLKYSVNIDDGNNFVEYLKKMTILLVILFHM